jgi:hypothetical protein
MPFPLIPILIGIGLALLTTVLNYLLRPHLKKQNPFDSPTYGFYGMSNSYEPGTPVALPYGTIQIPPAIINWYRSGFGGKTRANILGSLGHGPIAGCREIKINELPIRQYYSNFNKDCEIYITHGDYQQKVYKFVKKVEGKIKSLSGSSPTKTLVVECTNSRKFQSASAKEPGYLLLYGQSKDEGQETYEFVRYLSASQNGSEWTFKGVRVTKNFSVNDKVEQLYQIVKEDDGSVAEVIPHMGLTITAHQDIDNIEIPYSRWSETFTTDGKVDAFAVTFTFPEGLYKFDDKEGYKPNQVIIKVRWRKLGDSSWQEDVTEQEVVLDGTENYINVKEKTNYAVIADSSGKEITGTQENFDYLDNIEPGMEIEFIGNKEGKPTTYRYIIDSVFTEANGEYKTSDEDGSLIPLYRGKIRFSKQIKPSETDSGKYNGKTVKGKSYTIYYKKNVNPNITKLAIPETPKTIQGEYQVTYVFPHDSFGNEGRLPSYAKYEIEFKLISPATEHKIDKDAHKIVITSIEDIRYDKLTYPGEALIGLRLTMTEKISGSIDNITAIVDGLLIKNTSENISSLPSWIGNRSYSSLTDGNGQPVRIKTPCHHAYRLIKTGTSGSTEPNWMPIAGAVIFDGTCEWQEDSCQWSDNPLDIICDLQKNKMYGRGLYLDYDNNILGDLYQSYNIADTNGITDRQYTDHLITENNKPRRRFSVNINIDFRQPLIDTLELLAKSTRGYNYWDGQKLLTYIDRWRKPVTMINNANIVAGSFRIEEVKAEDKINRIYASFLNRHRKYKQDQVGRDYVDENFTVGDLIMEQIHLYGITDKWHANKILSYILKYSKYIKHIIVFEQGIDACIYNIGDVFYFSHEAVNNQIQIGSSKKWYSTCGRVISVSGSVFTVDKDITVTYGQKALLRKNDGTAEEYTIISQNGRNIVCNTTITNVSSNSIYSLGTTDSNNEYYRLFTCISKRQKDYTYEIVAITYDDNVFKNIYDTPIPSQEKSGTVLVPTEENDILNKIEHHKVPPLPVIAAKIKEDPTKLGQAIIYITRPVTSSNWSHAEVYIKDIDAKEWVYAGRTSGEPLRITGLIPGIDYEYEVKSYSYANQSSDIKIHGTFTYGGDSNELPIPTGLQIANRLGLHDQIYGRSFKLRWDDMTSQSNQNLSYAIRPTGYESLKYYVEIYFPDIPSTVKIGNTPVRDMVARHETISTNKYVYDYEDSMEDISRIFEKYPNNPYYNTYYNTPQRTIKIKVYCINDYSKKSAPAEKTVTNPKPGMFLSDGKTKITPTLKKLKSGIRVSFPHPYDSYGDEEYDISHFIIERCENSLFIGSTLKKRRITSVITVNSTEEDVADTFYETDYKSLDPKKTYYFRIKPYDVYGEGIVSNIASGKPGVSDDDESVSDDEIEKPQQVTGVTVTVSASNNVIIKWNKPSGTHAEDVVKSIIDWRASQFTGTPILTLTSAGGNIPTLGEVDQGYLNSNSDKKVYGETVNVEAKKDENEQYISNQYIIKNAKVGYKYFVKVRFENSSGKKGLWSSWAYNSEEVRGVSADDFDWEFKKYIYEGTFTAIDYNTVSWTNGTLKFKNADGTTTNYSISSGNTGNLTQDSYIVWPGDTPNKNTKFKVISVSEFWSGNVSGYTPMAYVSPSSDISQKAFFARFSDKQDFVINSSFIAAGSIITALIKAGAVTADKISVSSLSAISAKLGNLVMQDTDGSSITMKDASGTNRIYLSTITGSAPVLRISKPNKDATTNLAINDCIFTTDTNILGTNVPTNYKKIIDEFIFTIPNTSYWQDKTLSAGVHYVATEWLVGDNFPNGYGLDAPREVTGILFNPTTNSSANCEELAWGSAEDSSHPVAQYIQINFRKYTYGGQNMGVVRIDRVCVSHLPFPVTFPSLVGSKLKITVYGDLIT